MLTRLVSSRLPVLVYHPTKICDTAYMQALHRAGALPIMDTEFLTNTEIIQTLDRLSGSDLLFGLRLAVSNRALVDYLQRNPIANLDLVIFSYRTTEELQAFDFNHRDCKFVLEIVDIKLDKEIDRIAPHGLIVKGMEAPGKVSRNSALILLQWYLENVDLPIFVHGGVGRHTAAGLFAMGAHGIVLDNQLYLAQEAPLSTSYKELLQNLEEKDSTIIGHSLNAGYRFFAKLGTRIVKTLRDQEIQLADESDADEMLYREIEKNYARLEEDCETPIQSLFYLGQDAVFARHFTAMGDNVAAMIRELFLHVGEQLGAVDEHDPLRADAPLAREHGTRYPIMQGPMANVSDNADFAAAVFANGGLPFMALGNLPADLADTILKNGKDKVARFGAGMIGIEAFNQSITHHLDSVKKYEVPFALFAGGIPSQVKELEASGTRAYLHTPSLSMLDNAISKGCQRFIFEGSEAGGHVGELSSLVLWEQAIEKVERLPEETRRGKTLIFAGGIGTRRASQFISGMTARLAARGVMIGIQVGTSYLFSREIVETGAIRKLYQDVVCERDETILMGHTVGLASRTVATPFSERMIENEHQRLREGLPLHDRKKAFEKDNIGSLLIGAKAFCPDFDSASGEVCLINYEEEDQYECGNFMVGDCLTFNPCTTTIDDIHNAFFGGKDELAARLNALEIFSSPVREIEDEIAVIGMGCIYPGADSPDTLWQNIIDKHYAIDEMPAERLDPALYYDEDRKAEDKSYTKIAGIVKDFVFDHERYGYTPEKATRLSRSQQLVLECAYRAVADAGYLRDDLKLPAKLRASTAVIVATCLGNELGNDLHLKYLYPELKHYLNQIEAFNTLDDASRATLLDGLREGMANGMDYEPVHGQLLNIEASRIAHHMGIEGINYVVDAACATSFAALDCSIKELLSGEYDLVITGGVNTNLAPESFVGFSKMGALSARGSYPFDERADGFVLGEGAGVLVLKRMKDALRDGDRIHAVIKGVGASSDGKGKAIAAPNTKGQALALERCYEKIRDDVSVADIDYIEAHGTSTIAGDGAEIETLKQVYGGGHAVGISSIKSQVGHLLGGAGYAGLIKAILAIQHTILPPNGQFTKAAAAHGFEDSPLYIIEEARPWEARADKARMAAVSSYGFGGINYHCVVAEHTPSYRPLPRKIFADPDYDFNQDRIVFAGLGVVLPESPDVETFWQNLIEGRTVFSAIPEERFHNASYADEPEDSNYRIPMVKAGVVKDYRFNNVRFRIPPATARSLDRAQLFALDAANQAIEAANLKPLLTQGNRTGVILGTLPGERQVKNVLRVRLGKIERILEGIAGIDPAARREITARLLDQVRDRIPENNEDTIPGLLSNIVSGRIANTFGCNGANYVVDASCASATVAIRLAVRGLQSGDFDSVLTGGVDANFYPTVMLAFKRLSLLSDGDCRFFDKHAAGYVMSEGAAVQVVTTYRYARQHNLPILGEFGHTAFKSSVPEHLLSPSETKYGEALDECYRRLPVTKRQITHLDVFGVSNFFLDLMEKQALEARMPAGTFFGNIKSEFGYFKSANPAVVMTKLLLMNRAKTILPNYSYAPDSSIVGRDANLQANPRLLTLEDRQRLYFAANVNGVGGNHGHTVIGALPPWMATAAQPAVSVAAEKSTVAAAVPAQAPPAIAARPGGVVALISGQGAQYSGMLKPLYDENDEIRAVLDEGERIFQEMRGDSLLEIMFGEDRRLNLTENTQPAVFLSSAALFRYLQARGLAPDLFIGHSVGEYGALFCAGLLDFATTMRLIVKRADFMKAATEDHPGGIMVVFKDAAAVHSLIRDSHIKNIYVANKNSTKQTAVSGATADIDRFGAYLKDAKVMFKKLALSGAFHTPLFNRAAEQMETYLETVTFNPVDFSRVISNVTATPYPADAAAIKKLLVRQIISPVEFIASIEHARQAGYKRFYEIGPGRILVNLLKNIPIEDFQAKPTIDAKRGEVASLAKMVAGLQTDGLLQTVPEQAPRPAAIPPAAPPSPAAPAPSEENTMAAGADFEDFMARNEKALRDMAYQEYLKQKREEALKAVEQFDFYTGKAVVAGAAIGLPGSGNKVFNSNNFEKLLAGNNFIEPLSREEKEKIVDMNITRVFKQPDGNARFLEITDTRDVIQLAGKLGYFNLKNEYGVDYDYDVTISLAIAAGIEALKDAHIPLVLQHKLTSTGNRIPNGHALPEEMQTTTGVIMTSLFPGFETLIEQLNKYYYNKFYVRPYKELENIYYHLMESVRDSEIKAQITDWFFKIKERRKKYGTYKFERNLLFDVVPLGSAHFAQLIKAKGPNMMMSGACASTTQAMGVAEDWIRTGRCERVIIVGGEASTSETQSPWIASGFLALGAASIKEVVTDAAKPFDAERNGTILGAGAVSLIVEREDRLRARGLNGQAEILGTYIGNSAFHATQIDQTHLTEEMARFVRRVETRHNIDPAEYTRQMVFMSHETFTPARGGSASAEVGSLKTTYPDHYRNITITNTKGFTGHTLGAAIEDAVMIKALQAGRVPPIANLSHIPEEFEDLQFSCGENGCGYEYGLHYAAGFGSHFAFLMVRRIVENQVQENPAYQNWLRRISGLKQPRLKVIDNTLCIDPDVISEVETLPAPAEVPATDVPAAAQAPPAAAAAEAPQTPAVAAPAAAGDLLVMVKKIVAEQTGYTADMLEDELDLEADLGIDTVKQVEIFGKVSAHFGLDVPEDLKLNDLNTIAKIGDYLDTRVPAAPVQETQAAPAAVVEKTTATTDPAESPVKRMVVRAVPAAATSPRAGWFKGRRVLITADHHGFTALMAERIKSDGGEPVVIGDTPNADISCDWSSPAAVKAAVKEIKGRHTDVDGLLHFLPLDGALDGQGLEKVAIDRRLKHFFILVQGLYDELNRPGRFIAMPAFNAAVLPFVDSAGAIDPVSAGLAGLLKTVRKELSDTYVKIVDFDPQATARPDEVIDTFTRELTSGEQRVECGYRGDQRWVLLLEPEKPEQTGALVQENDTVLVTGGARGITFEILKTLASAIPVRLEILGRSDVDGLDPTLAAADLSEADIMARLKAEMQGAKPLEIRRALDRIVKLRESAANLKSLRALGARVTYHAVDVTDAATVRRIIAATGGIDVVLHAAGIEESQMIPKKTMASFDRVFDTKVLGLTNLLAALDHKTPRCLMTFSSVTARFGNEGQADYTAANDMIAKILLDFRRQNPQTVVKIFDWTAWEGAGMATNETVNKVLRERGLTFLPLADGVAHFMNELGDDTSPEVVFSGIDRAFDPDGLMIPEAAAGSVVAPLLDRVVSEEQGLRTYLRTLDLERDLFLLDHSREDVPIFLGATGIEAMAEAAARLAAPGHVLRELQDFAIPYGIKILKQRPKEITIEAAAASPDADTFRCRITSQFRNKKGIAMGEPKLHYHGSYTFGPAEVAPPVINLPEFHPVNYDGDIQALLYHPARLFMDGLFRTVEDILSFETDRLISRIRFTSDRPFMADDPRPAFVTDVAVVDAMFQTGGMLEVMTTNIIVLPYTIRRMHFHRPVAPQHEYLCITQRIASGQETNTYRLQLVDPEGHCYITIEDFEMVQVDQLSADDQIVDQLNIGVQRRRAS